MRSLRAFAAHAWAFVRRRTLDDDFHQEINSHLEEATDDFIRQGMSPDHARRAAYLSFGGVSQAQQVHREHRTFAWLESLGMDLRRASRTVWKQPVFTAAVTGSLALGIGANTAVFSVLNAVAFKSLPVAHADRLVQVTPGGAFSAWTYPLWEQFQDRQNVFDSVFAWSSLRGTFDLGHGGPTDTATGLWVSGGFFEGLGVRPFAGRLLEAADDTRGGGPDGLVAVISYRFWQRHFGGAPDAVGRTLSIERLPFKVVGVVSPEFLGPDVGSAFDVALPLGVQPVVIRSDRLPLRNWWWLSVMGRLRPGQTPKAAAASLTLLQPHLRDVTSPANGRAGYLDTPMTVTAAPGGPSSLRDTYERALTVLLGIVALVLLIASVNVANLLLGRAERARADVSLRLALGASRARLIRELLIESLVFSAIGALAGLVLARLSVQWLVAQLPASATLDAALDVHILLFTALLSLGVTAIFGMIPAFHGTNVRPIDALKGRRAASGGGPGRTGAALIVVQFAFCLVLVVAATVFVRTFVALTSQHLGIDSDRILIVNLETRHSERASRDRSRTLYDELMNSIQAIPGVAAVSYSAVTPLSHNEWNTAIENPPGFQFSERDRQVYKNVIGPGWFATYGIPLAAGRDFRAVDQTTPEAIAIVNEAFSRRYLGEASPIGRTIREVGSQNEPMPALTIVGLVGNAVYSSLREIAPPTIYVPATDGLGGSGGGAELSIRVAVPMAAAQLIAPVTATIAKVDGNLGVTCRLVATDVGEFSSRERLLAWMAGVFGVIGLLLAALGLYGVVWYAVGVKRAEIGVRMALGASEASVIGMIMRRVALLMTAGALIGAPLSVAATQSLSALLFDVAPSDPLVLTSAILIMALTGALAAWLPVRRAARTNPAIALRAD